MTDVRKAASTLRAAFAAMALATISAAPASAFYCYVPEKPDGPIALRERPDDASRIVARMEPGGMVRMVVNRREPEGWVQVRWQREALSRRFDATGWARRDQIRGGECAD
jgi:SH3-like domain-containing protein